MSAQPVRVALDVSSAVDPRPTGVARFIELLAAALDRADGGIELCRCARASRMRGLRKPGAHNLVSWSRALWQGYDVFHGPDLRFPRLKRGPVIVTVHDLSAFERSDHATARFLRKKQHAIERAIRRADAIVTHTLVIRDQLIERFQLSRTRVHAIPLGAGVLSTRAGAEPLAQTPERLLVVGGPSRRKGSDRVVPLLDLWRQRLDYRPTIDWVGSGKGEDLPPGSCDQLRFHGHVNDGRLCRLYEQADGLLFLSDTEGFGIPLVEAAAFGVPIVAIDSPTSREVLGDSAIWFSEPLEDSMDAFREFLDPRVRNRIRTDAREHTRDLTWENCAGAYAALYRSLATACVAKELRKKNFML